MDSEKPTLAATTRGGPAKAPEAAASRSGQDGANTHARRPPAARGAERVHPFVERFDIDPFSDFEIFSQIIEP